MIMEWNPIDEWNPNEVFAEANKERIGRGRGGYEKYRLNTWKAQGISIDTYGQFLTLLALAGFKCEICRRDLSEQFAHLDHEHWTGRVRGVLCRSCNRALGQFYDSVDHLISAAVYLIDGGN